MTRQRLNSFILSALGAAVFVFAGIPLPWLLGPMLACLIASLAGARLQGPGTLGVFMRTFLGVAVGASITPEMIRQVPEMALSLAFIPVFIAAIALICYPLLRKLFGFDHPTAWYAAMPGGLQDMLVFGQEAGGDVRALSLIHATRILVIVTMAPLLMSYFWDLDLTLPPGDPIRDASLSQIVLMLVAAFFGWKIAERVGLFGASILGPMILTVILSLTGLIEHRPPAEVIQAAQFFIGMTVGVKYAGITLRELRVDVTAGLVLSALLAMISLLFFEVIMLIGLAPPLDALLAFLPGGQAEMVVIAIIAGADLTYVVSHHLLRIIIVITLAPLVSKLVCRPRR